MLGSLRFGSFIWRGGKQALVGDSAEPQVAERVLTGVLAQDSPPLYKPQCHREVPTLTVSFNFNYFPESPPSDTMPNEVSAFLIPHSGD